MSIDPLDLKILSILEQDASISNLDLSKQVHASPATCLRRVARLRNDGIITRIVALLDPASVGLPLTAIIEISLDHQGAERFDQFEAAAMIDPTVRSCYRMSGGVDFVLTAHFEHMDAYHVFAHRLLGQAANVRNVRTLFSTHCAKLDTRRLPQDH